jgi:hypothetical protein
MKSVAISLCKHRHTARSDTMPLQQQEGSSHATAQPRGAPTALSSPPYRRHHSTANAF